MSCIYLFLLSELWTKSFVVFLWRAEITWIIPLHYSDGNWFWTDPNKFGDFWDNTHRLQLTSGSEERCLDGFVLCSLRNHSRVRSRHAHVVDATAPLERRILWVHGIWRSVLSILWYFSRTLIPRSNSSDFLRQSKRRSRTSGKQGYSWELGPIDVDAEIECWSIIRVDKVLRNKSSNGFLGTETECHRPALGRPFCKQNFHIAQYVQ